jgi:hypothetical protein
VSHFLLFRPSYCCWGSTPSIPPANLGTVCGVLLGTWTLWPSWQRGSRCGSYAWTAGFRSSSQLGRLHLPSSHYFATWQAEWDSALGSKLLMVKPSVQEWQSSFRAVRKDEVALKRLRICHTHPTHGHFLRGQPEPVCTHCGVPLTAARILMDCPRYTEARRMSPWHRNLRHTRR